MEYELSAGQALDARLQIFERSSAARGAWYWMRYIYFTIGIMLAIVGFINLAGGSGFTAAASLFPAAILIVFALVWPLLRRRMLRRQFQKAHGQGQDLLVGRHRLSMDDSGVRDAMEKGETVSAWKAVEELGRTRDYVYMIEPGVSLYVAPRSAFPSEDAFIAFYERAKGYWRSTAAADA